MRKPSHAGADVAPTWSVISTSLFGSAPWSPPPLTVEVTARHRSRPRARWYRVLVTARVGVVVFPGTNCEHDVVEAFEVLGAEADLVWHGSASLSGLDAVVLPGGFAHGDYLRPGAIARFSPVMAAVRDYSPHRADR